MINCFLFLHVTYARASKNIIIVLKLIISLIRYWGKWGLLGAVLEQVGPVGGPLAAQASRKYLHGCFATKESFDSCPSNLSTHLSIIIHQVSPTPTGRTPWCLYWPIKRPTMSTRYEAHGGRSFANHSVNSATICLMTERNYLQNKHKNNQPFIIFMFVLKILTFSHKEIDAITPSLRK